MASCVSAQGCAHGTGKCEAAPGVRQRRPKAAPARPKVTSAVATE